MFRDSEAARLSLRWRASPGVVWLWTVVVATNVWRHILVSSLCVPPQWLAKRKDFCALKNDQATCGPVFVRQALTTPGDKRRDQELKILVKWLRQHNLFHHLHDVQLRVIARALTLSRIVAGQTLYPEKRVAYFVLSGKAAVARPGEAPATVSAGQCLGARFWWSVVANGIKHRATRLGRRMSQILLEAEAAESMTRVTPEDAMVGSINMCVRVGVWACCLRHCVQ